MEVVVEVVMKVDALSIADRIKKLNTNVKLLDEIGALSHGRATNQPGYRKALLEELHHRGAVKQSTPSILSVIILTGHVSIDTSYAMTSRSY